MQVVKATHITIGDLTKNHPPVYFRTVPDMAAHVEKGIAAHYNAQDDDGRDVITLSSVIDGYDCGSLDVGAVHMGVTLRYVTPQAALVGFMVSEDVNVKSNSDFAFTNCRKHSNDISSRSLAEVGAEFAQVMLVGVIETGCAKPRLVAMQEYQDSNGVTVHVIRTSPISRQSSQVVSHTRTFLMILVRSLMLLLSIWMHHVYR